jgi:ferredoxin-NADP reductase
LSQCDLERGVTIRSVFPELAAFDLYVCCPQAWTDLVVEDARAAGLPAHQIHTERFDW